MDRTRLYHGLTAAFGAFVLAWGTLQISSSVSLTAVLFVVAGLGMLFTSVAAFVRPDLVTADEPATWKIALVAFGVLLFVLNFGFQLLQ